MFPVFWFESLSELPEEMSGSLNMLLVVPTVVKFSALTALILSSLAMIIIIIIQILEEWKIFLIFTVPFNSYKSVAINYFNNNNSYSYDNKI